MTMNTLNQILKENVTVYTRTASSDYEYHFKSLLLDNSTDMRQFELMGFEAIDRELKGENGTTSWLQINILDGVLLFRGVIDGKIDLCSRRIKE